MVSKRVKYALAHLTRKRHMSLLARPNWRRLQKFDVHCLASPFTVSRRALKCHASKRLKVMAQARFVKKKYDPTKQAPSYTRIHPQTLNAKASKRIMDLALPRKKLFLFISLVLASKRFVTGNKSMAASINRLLYKIRKSRYQKYRVLCNATEQQAAHREAQMRKHLHKALSKPEDWARHNRFLDKFAGPKIIPEPEKIDRGEKKNVAEMKRITVLSTPVNKEMPMTRDPFQVPQSALKYKISPRIAEIAFRKRIPENISTKPPWQVSPAACKAVATPRTIVLAKPAVRPAGLETDLKEDAFSVPPRALKAKCTPRVKKLAKPKTYGKAK